MITGMLLGVLIGSGLTLYAIAVLTCLQTEGDA